MSEQEFDFNADLSDLILQAEPDVVPPVSAARKVGMSLRLDPAVMKELLDRAAERGVGHTVLAAELIEAGLAGMRDEALVPLADVQRVIAQLARRSATPPAA
jgi:hypothetical protein